VVATKIVLAPNPPLLIRSTQGRSKEEDENEEQNKDKPVLLLRLCANNE
jgi:hypothetical protein